MLSTLLKTHVAEFTNTLDKKHNVPGSWDYNGFCVTHERDLGYYSLNKKRVSELREMCKKEGKPVTGKKQELIDRLKKPISFIVKRAVEHHLNQTIEESKTIQVAWDRYTKRFTEQNEKNRDILDVKGIKQKIKKEGANGIREYTCDVLRQICKDCELKQSGKKDELRVRILEHLGHYDADLSPAIKKKKKPKKGDRKTVSFSPKFIDVKVKEMVIDKEKCYLEEKTGIVLDADFVAFGVMSEKGQVLCLPKELLLSCKERNISFCIPENILCKNK